MITSLLGGAGGFSSYVLSGTPKGEADEGLIMYMMPHPSIATFHGTNEDGNKAGKKQTGHTKAGTYTQLSSSLHQKERGGNEGTAQRETRTIKTNRKIKHHLQIGDEACAFSQGSKQRTVFLSTQRPPGGTAACIAAL